MGNQPAKLPVSCIPDSYVAISICKNSEIRVMNAAPEVKDMLVTLEKEIIAKGGNLPWGPLIEDCGTLKMRVGNDLTFLAGYGSKDGATLGKIFALRVLEEMYNLGYDLIVSSELSIKSDDHATWFFSKSEVPGNRSQAKVCCITPGDPGRMAFFPNKLILLRHDEHVKTAVMLALGDAWPKGVSEGGCKDVESLGEVLHEIMLFGFWGGTDEDGISTQKTICNLLGRMGGLNWRLLTSTHLRGSDSYFFIHDPTYTAHPNDFCMLALAEKNRFRLINCDHLVDSVEGAIVSSGCSVQEKGEYHGSKEIRVFGSPWSMSDNWAITGRRSISRTLEVFGKNGYMPLCAVDFCRREIDKSSIILQKCPSPVNPQYGCLSLNEWKFNRIQILDFPVDVGAPMRDSLYQFYPFGVPKEVNLADSNLEINIAGNPWQTGFYTRRGDPYHMRAVLGKMMAVAAEHGWHVSFSADVSESSRNVHSIYFVKML